LAIDGGTESIRACIVDPATGTHLHTPVSAPYDLLHPHPGWATQDPKQWWESLGSACRGAVKKASESKGYDIAADVVSLCVDTTCCSVVFMGVGGEVIGDSIIWMDQRSAPQCRIIMERARGDPALEVNSGGAGPVSAEWFLPKCMWMKSADPDTWKAVVTACEYQDFVNFKLTGDLVGCSSNAAVRWHCDGDKLASGDVGGLPITLWEKCGIPELATKIPKTFVPPGGRISNLTPAAASHLGLTES
ncbi:hypothetical protein TrRE_jg2131, partial [Triparma retinervis]